MAYTRSIVASDNLGWITRLMFESLCGRFITIMWRLNSHIFRSIILQQVQPRRAAMYAHNFCGVLTLSDLSGSDKKCNSIKLSWLRVAVYYLGGMRLIGIYSSVQEW